MKKIPMILGLALALALFAGCVSVHVPTPADDLAVANKLGYGAPPPEDWQDQVKALVLETLKDPDSAKFKFTEKKPEEYYVRQAPASGREFAAGFMLTCEVNAKNSYGGYVGFKPYKFIMRDGKIIAYATVSSSGYYFNWSFLAGCPTY